MAGLEIKGLTVHFGGLTALLDLSFRVEDQEIVALIGPNGAGKTTTFNLITGFLLPVRGEVIFKGKNIIGFSPHKIASKGMIRTFQKTNVFPSITVFEGMMMGRHSQTKSGFLKILFNTYFVRGEEKKSKEKVESILDSIGLSHRSDELAKNLPYGEQRLLEIGIALAGEPTFLLLDEPFTGMNMAEKGQLMRLVEKIRSSGITILLVEHDMNVVMEISDRIVVLNHGKKIGEGKPEEIQKNEGVVEAYLGVQ